MDNQHTPVKERIILEGDQHPGKKDDGAWLNAGLPALHGPHSDRPWGQVLGTFPPALDSNPQQHYD